MSVCERYLGSARDATALCPDCGGLGNLRPSNLHTSTKYLRCKSVSSLDSLIANSRVIPCLIYANAGKGPRSVPSSSCRTQPHILSLCHLRAGPHAPKLSGLARRSSREPLEVLPFMNPRSFCVLCCNAESIRVWPALHTVQSLNIGRCNVSSTLRI